MKVKTEFTEQDEKERIRRAKIAILKEYPTIRSFIERFKSKFDTRNTNFTIGDTINKKNICRYLEFCRIVRLDPFDLSPLNEFTENRKVNLLENRILAMYCDLNRKGRLRFFELLTDLWSIEKYRRV